MFCDNDSIYVITIVGNDRTLQLMEKNSEFNGQEVKVKYGALAKNIWMQDILIMEPWQCSILLKILSSFISSTNMEAKSDEK